MTRKFRINAFEPIDKLRGKTIIGFPSNAKKKKFLHLSQIPLPKYRSTVTAT